jgi:hypothetical protein
MSYITYPIINPTQKGAAIFGQTIIQLMRGYRNRKYKVYPIVGGKTRRPGSIGNAWWMPWNI